MVIWSRWTTTQDKNIVFIIIDSDLNQFLNETKKRRHSLTFSSSFVIYTWQQASVTNPRSVTDTAEKKLSIVLKLPIKRIFPLATDCPIVFYKKANFTKKILTSANYESMLIVGKQKLEKKLQILETHSKLHACLFTNWLTYRNLVNCCSVNFVTLLTYTDWITIERDQLVIRAKKTQRWSPKHLTKNLLRTLNELIFLATLKLQFSHQQK